MQEMADVNFATAARPRRWTLLSMNSYQWTVFIAAWLGWGFDIFDALLFNYVAPSCVPVLLNLPLGSPEAKSATLWWTGLLSSMLLIGWAIGGVVFGKVADRIGRTRTLLITMLMYSIGTALCAFAPNIWGLMICRMISSLGIGGEWAAGASMVAEVVPEKRRVEAGALLSTASPMGLLLATVVTYQITRVYFREPSTSWRYVFLFGLFPAAIAFVVRVFVKEPERWKQLDGMGKPRIRELFSDRYLRFTISGLSMAVIALITWWSCNAFIPLVAKGLAQHAALQMQNLDAVAIEELGHEWIRTATTCFNLGGVTGALLTIPAAKLLGRKKMFLIYLAFSAVAITIAFGLNMDPHTRLFMYLPIGLSTQGMFGCFTFYLPELYPTRLRATGAGFTFNMGRVIAAGGPFLVGGIAASGATVETSMYVLLWVAAVPLVGILLLPLVIETRNTLMVD